jgi:predicted PurR-regulated permease PerM
MVRLAAADPAAVGWAVRVHPLAVILALLVAAPLFGLLAMVFAVPVAAAVKILAGYW